MVEPVVVWFTGLPSSGKTALARRVSARLSSRGVTPVLLDGDDLRSLLVPGGGYDEVSRLAFYGALCDLAARLARQGHVVLVSATAHRRAFRDAARLAAPRFVEVYLDVTIDEARSRDRGKGLYDGTKRVGAGALPGVDVAYEAPQTPEVVARGADDEVAVEAVVGLVVGGALGATGQG